MCDGCGAEGFKRRIDETISSATGKESLVVREKYNDKGWKAFSLESVLFIFVNNLGNLEATAA